MSPDFEKPFSEQTKHEKKPYFQLADDQLKISHSGTPRIHRVYFISKKGNGNIPVQSSIFFKLRSKMENWQDNNLLNFWKNSSFTFGLSKNGRFTMHVKSDLEVFPKEFLRCLRQDFNFDDFEIYSLIEKLDFIDLEIAHKINDPEGNLKNAKVRYIDLEGLIRRLIAFVDQSNGSLELELKGDPETSTNLDFLLRDKLHAILFFTELTKIVKKLAEIQSELFDSIQYISRALTFILDDLLNRRLNKTKQKEVDKNRIT